MTKIKDQIEFPDQRDAIDEYFECVTACSLSDDGIECLTHCVAIQLSKEANSKD